MSMLLSQFAPPSPSPTVFTSLFLSLCLYPFSVKRSISVVRILKTDRACEASHMVPSIL